MCINVFFFKQKTAYEMRISDWSSDVCSSDLHRSGEQRLQVVHVRRLARRIGIDVIAHVVPAEIVIAGADERSGTAAERLAAHGGPRRGLAGENGRAHV